MPRTEAPRSLPLRPGEGEACRRRLAARFRVGVDTLDETVSYFDTFDWRLYERGTTIVVTANGDGPIARPASITWETLAGLPRRALPAMEVPAFVWELPPGPARDELEPILGVRRLLRLVDVRRRGSRMRILDDEGKTVLRLRWLERRTGSGRSLEALLRIEPLRGYEDWAREIEDLVSSELAARPQPACELDEALSAIGCAAQDYTSKVSIELQPEMPTEAALRRVQASLLLTIRANENGVIEDLDSEFLHDFRVAVRRTRSALTQIKGVYPAAATRRFRTAFSWLGSLTGPQRDLDVYLLQLRQDRDGLSVDERDDLRPVEEVLYRRRTKEHRVLARSLSGKRYRTLLHAWETHLETPVAKHPTRPNAQRPILDVASRRTWKIYRRVLARGMAIDDDSPDRDLHRLRIEAKKLRYLMELFRSLYPDELGRQIKALKRLQDLLGDFNDDSVQERLLRDVARELGQTVSSETHLVLGRLVERLHLDRRVLRAGFMEAFSSFASADNRAACRELFRHPREADR